MAEMTRASFVTQARFDVASEPIRELETALRHAQEALFWYRAENFEMDGRRIGDVVDSALSSYRCPVCGVNDQYAYMRCNHPGCPDGRDISVREKADKLDAPPQSSAQRGVVG